MQRRCFSLLLILFCLPVFAEEPAKTVKATTPEVQTAAWAQKWWMPRHKQKLADLKEQRQVDLLWIGDSITHGWENSGKRIWQQYYASRNAFNIGFSGDRTENVLWRLENGAVEGISPKLAILMIGTNNTGHRQDPAEQTAAGVQAIIKQLRERLPKTKVLVLAVFPRGAKPEDKLRKLNDQINRILATYADDKHVFYQDLSGTFLQDDGVLPKSIMPDLLHPNEKGYELWAEAIEPNMKKLMGE